MRHDERSLCFPTPVSTFRGSSPQVTKRCGNAGDSFIVTSVE